MGNMSSASQADGLFHLQVLHSSSTHRFQWAWINCTLPMHVHIHGRASLNRSHAPVFAQTPLDNKYISALFC